jgi:D-amino-acid oxidase
MSADQPTSVSTPSLATVITPSLSHVNGTLTLNVAGTRPRYDLPRKRILVVGGGVTGLTVCRREHRTFAETDSTFIQTAWVLLDAGYDVTILSERWASPSDPITSQIAGAL